ncbi:MAG: hypothetical protein AAGF85_03915 [Bacteroidota bacterium]
MYLGVMPNNESDLIEQYKLYVTMADKVSDRRSKTNQFYITLLSALLVVVSLVVNKDGLVAQNVVLLSIGILGLIICLIWAVNIRSYRKLNTAKFKIIHELETRLNYPGFTIEWEILGKGMDKKNYLQLTRVEALIPSILTIPFLTLSIYAIVQLLS